MKYAVVSDIHANIEAFTAVLNEIDRQDVAKIVCLGDSVGYYTNPNECLEIIQSRKIASVAGNHDRAGTGLKEPIEGCVEEGKRAITWTIPRLSPKNQKFLDDLPLVREVDGQFLIVHASLYPTPNEEIYIRHNNKETIQNNFDALVAHPSKAKICFFGHTHYPVCHRLLGKEMLEIKPSGVPVELNDADYFLINPGSVGQSRDADPRASFLTYDTGSNMIHFYRVDYNRNACLGKARQAGLLIEDSRFHKSVVWILDKLGIKEFIKKMVLRR